MTARLPTPSQTGVIMHAFLFVCRGGMLGADGVAGPAGAELIGDEAAPDAGLGRLGEAGAPDYLAQIMADDTASAARTFEYLAGKCAG